MFHTYKKTRLECTKRLGKIFGCFRTQADKPGSRPSKRIFEEPRTSKILFEGRLPGLFYLTNPVLTVTNTRQRNRILGKNGVIALS